MTIDELVRDYRKSPGYMKLSMGSFRTYDHAIKTLLDHFRGRKVIDIKRSDMVRLMHSLASTPATANLMMRVASVLFSYAVDVDVIPYNPVFRLKKLKIGSHERWHPEEVTKAIGYPDRIVSAAVALAWYTGQRESDVLKMQWSDLKDGYFTVKQNKTKVEIGIKAHADVLAYLIKLRNDEPDHYYIVSGAKMVAGQTFRARFARAMKKIGIAKTFHGIRKGVASTLAENGRSTTEIAAILGHKTTRMAEYYAEQASGRKLAANAVDSLTSCV